jgi:hypothetical protein
MKTNKEQLEQIQNFIQDELLKRGFQAPIIEIKEIEDKRIEFHTANFQTTPVLFKSLQISNFNSSFSTEKVNNMTLDTFWIRVSVRYEHFNGGSNGVDLFAVTGTLSGDRVYDLRTS